MSPTQPPRSPSDGPVSVSRTEDGSFRIACEQGDSTTVLVASPHNVWRIFGSLALMLGVSLPKAVGKRIIL